MVLLNSLSKSLIKSLAEISNRLTKKYSDIDADWKASYDDENGLMVSREVRGVSENMSIGRGLFDSADSEDLKKYLMI